MGIDLNYFIKSNARLCLYIPPKLLFRVLILRFILFQLHLGESLLLSTLHYLVVPIPVVDAVEQLATVANALEPWPVLVVTLKVKLQGKAGLQ